DVAREDLALADVVGGRHHAFALHALDDAGGAVVADLQVALDEAGRALALTRDQGDRLIVELVALALLAFARRTAASLLALGIVGHGVDIGRHALRPQVPHHLLDLAVRHERPVHACDLAAAGHVQHVALAQQLLAALLAQDGAAVD